MRRHEEPEFTLLMALTCCIQLEGLMILIRIFSLFLEGFLFIFSFSCSIPFFSGEENSSWDLKLCKHRDCFLSFPFFRQMAIFNTDNRRMEMIPMPEQVRRISCIDLCKSAPRRETQPGAVSTNDGLQFFFVFNLRLDTYRGLSVSFYIVVCKDRCNQITSFELGRVLFRGEIRMYGMTDCPGCHSISHSVFAAVVVIYWCRTTSGWCLLYSSLSYS